MGEESRVFQCSQIKRIGLWEKTRFQGDRDTERERERGNFFCSSLFITLVRPNSLSVHVLGTRGEVIHARLMRVEAVGSCSEKCWLCSAEKVRQAPSLDSICACLAFNLIARDLRFLFVFAISVYWGVHEVATFFKKRIFIFFI